MSGSTDKNKLLEKLTGVRMQLCWDYPFYGTLLFQLKFGLAPCGTAGTDMRRILWDPAFLDRLSPAETAFVMLHELLHCVLDHPGRGKGRDHFLYNVAADIVVNSGILHFLGREDFRVGGKPVMHLTPDGAEGCLYTADQVYEMLLKKYREKADDRETMERRVAEDYGEGMDDHGRWESCPPSPLTEECWKRAVREAAAAEFRGSLPPFVRKLLEDGDDRPKIDWRRALNDFIRMAADRFDYSFSPPDRRFSEQDLFLPAFSEEEECEAKLFLFLDSSGSISDAVLTEAFREVRAAVGQFARFSGRLSFFDTAVTEPVEFSTREELSKVIPKGGGGTSFHCIFDYVREHTAEDPPAALVILTDGCAVYPKEEAAGGIPVLWILINHPQDAPWGRCVHMETEE